MPRKTKKTILGLPIYGEVQHDGSNTKQEPWTKFEDALRGALAIPGFVGVRWVQYTPYFNDGEPCYFRVSMHGFKFLDTDEEAGDWEDGYDDMIPGAPNGRWGNHPSTGKYGWIPDVVGDRGTQRYQAAEAFRSAVEDGHHKVKLQDVFGDHSTVTVTQTKIEVEFYDHE